MTSAHQMTRLVPAKSTIDPKQERDRRAQNSRSQESRFLSAWVRFPIDSRRKTGLLFPDIGSDGRGGLDILSPFILIWRPITTPSIALAISRARVVHQGQGRWLSDTVGYWEMNGGWIGDDERYQNANPRSMPIGGY